MTYEDLQHSSSNLCCQKARALRVVSMCWQKALNHSLETIVETYIRGRCFDHRIVWGLDWVQLRAKELCEERDEKGGHGHPQIEAVLETLFQQTGASVGLQMSTHLSTAIPGMMRHWAKKGYSSNALNRYCL